MLLQAQESRCSSATSNVEFLPRGDETLSSLQCSGLTRGQLFALTLAFVLKHCLTQAATSDLIALLNAVLPGCLPPNLYHYNKVTDYCKHMCIATSAILTLVILLWYRN